MKVAISNIAWRPEQDPVIAGLMAQCHVEGLEIAPTAIWANPATVSMADASAYRRWWESRGITIVAMQALLYGRPELTIFNSENDRLATLEYLALIFRLAGWLGATRLVFGSPANRRAGHLPPGERDQIATDFFRRAGDSAHACGTTLCLEPNPPQYGCDFVNRAGEARALIERVASPGFGLHLDAGAMTLQNESPDEMAAGLPLHFHISEPNLVRIGSGATNHAGFARALSDHHYTGWCSIEARRPADDVIVEEIAGNLAFATETYGAG